MYNLQCRNCNQVLDANDIVELTGLYLLHCVKDHWDELMVLRNATTDEILEAVTYAHLQGWI